MAMQAAGPTGSTGAFVNDSRNNKWPDSQTGGPHAWLTLIQCVVLPVLGGGQDGHQNVGATPQGNLPAHCVDGLQKRAFCCL